MMRIKKVNFDTTGDRGVNQILLDKFEGKKKPAISAGFFRIWLPDLDSNQGQTD